MEGQRPGGRWISRWPSPNVEIIEFEFDSVDAPDPPAAVRYPASLWLAPEVEQMVSDVVQEALELGWTWSALWSTRRWTSVGEDKETVIEHQPRSLAAVLSPLDSIIEVTEDYIAILKVMGGLVLHWRFAS